MKVTQKDWVYEHLPKRTRNSHKGDYGRAVIVAGSMEYTGAAYLSTAACLRSGVGYTTLCIPQELFSIYALKAPEALLKIVSKGGRYAFNEQCMQDLLGYDAIAYGMGMGCSKEVFYGIKWLIENYQGKLLIDADGLNSIATYGDLQVFSQKRCAVIVTPHVKEFSRLSGYSMEAIVKNGEELVRNFSKQYGVTVLLKNAYSLVCDGTRLTCNQTGNSGQAKGGSGDVLSGLIVGLLAQGANGFDGAAMGAYLVGKAAEIATKTVGEYSLTASDLIENLGRAFLFVTEHANEEGSQQ